MGKYFSYYLIKTNNQTNRSKTKDTRGLNSLDTRIKNGIGTLFFSFDRQTAKRDIFKEKGTSLNSIRAVYKGPKKKKRGLQERRENCTHKALVLLLCRLYYRI